MKAWLRENSLTIALLTLFLISIVGQVLAGYRYDNDEIHQHGQASISFAEYLKSGFLISSVFENWESEFLQMWVYVMLTAYLYQRGSPESKKPDEPAPQDRDPALDEKKRSAPWPVRAGGLARALYGHSLGLAMLLLFLASFVMHWLNSDRAAREDALLHNQSPPGLVEYLGEPRFWFESFQNWQSEFLSTAVLIVLAIFLRERKSPESKPVSAPHSQTGEV
jgi:hypothetical protein